jgi:hypothetical protein
MGRRKPSAAFSLFSFQDIITSVTAILVLVMLLLTIELVTRRRQQAITDPDSTRRQIEATVTRLESVASRLRDEVAARRAQRPSRSQEAARQALARVQADLVATKRRLEETLRTQEAVARALTELEARAAERTAERETLVKLELQLAEDREEADRLEAANRKEEDRQEKRKREIADTPRSGTELVFNPPADSDRRAWLVELSVDGAAVVLLGGDRNEKLGSDTGADNALARWIASLTAEGDYCLLLVRPSATTNLSDELEKRLNDAGIKFGIDLIGEEQTVRDGSKAAN